MDIQEFFQLCAGKWVSQRTIHNLTEQKNQSGRSDLWVELLEASRSEVADLCRQFEINSALTFPSVQIRWSEAVDVYQSRFKAKTNEGSVVLVAVVDSNHPNTGQLLRKLNSTASIGAFSLGADEALTLSLDVNGVVTEERIWFASPNLRFRSSLIQQNGSVCMTTFCSEIRMVSSAAEVPSSSTTAQSGAS